MRYFEQAKALWKSSVPERGQADTVQGELLRALEKLRDEAMRNGNINWDESHQILLGFLRSTLLGDDTLGAESKVELARDLDRLADYERPVTNDDFFNRIVDHLMEWCIAHPTPIPHPPNPRLHR
jgi:hypothetical protein